MHCQPAIADIPSLGSIQINKHAEVCTLANYHRTASGGDAAARDVERSIGSSGATSVGNSYRIGGIGKIDGGRTYRTAMAD
jgi:hypothetical protein